MNAKPLNHATHMHNDTVTLNAPALLRPALSSSPLELLGDGTATVSLLAVGAAQEAQRGSPVPLVAPRGPAEFPSDWLLRVLTCSYAKGVLSSDEIARKLRVELPSGSPLPDARALRGFRRLNRRVIEASLEKVLRILRLRRVAGTTSVRAAAAGIGAETAVVLHYEARARVEDAVIMDHALAED